jgi:hypothetical protein
MSDLSAGSKAYRQAHTAFRLTTLAVEDMVNAIVAAARRLRVRSPDAWQKVKVTGFDIPGEGDPEFPEPIAPNFPSGHEFGMALLDWHQKRALVREAFAKVPAGERAKLPKPPT